METDFAVMDDSMMHSNGLYVYTHALVLYDEVPRIKVFTGSKKEVYGHGDELLEFVSSNLYEGCIFYACSHYVQYKDIWNLVECAAKDRDAPRIVRREFLRAHTAANMAARKKLEELVLDG